MKKSSEKWIAVGRLGKPVGVAGGLRMESYNPESDLLTSMGQISIGSHAHELTPITLAKTEKRAKNTVVWISGVEVREQAKELVGQELFIKRSALPPLPEDEYYWCDLIGMEIETSEGVALGTLAQILPTASNDIFVVQQGEKEILLPALADVVVKVDVAKRKIVANPPEVMDAF